MQSSAATPQRPTGGEGFAKLGGASRGELVHHRAFQFSCCPATFLGYLCAPLSWQAVMDSAPSGVVAHHPDCLLEAASGTGHGYGRAGSGADSGAPHGGPGG
jgi:hypothetical protein